MRPPQSGPILLNSFEFFFFPSKSARISFEKIADPVHAYRGGMLFLRRVGFTPLHVIRVAC